MSDMVPEVLNAALDSLFTPKEPGELEYQGDDGLLYCRNCHTPVQCRVKLWGRDKIVPCLCRCQQEAMAEKKRQDELVERQRKIRQLKATGIQEKHLLEWNFGVAEDNKDIDDYGIGGNQMKENWVYRRGDIYLANLGVPIGSKQGGVRPVVVLQNDVGNFYSPMITVAPLTTKIQKKRNQPTHYFLRKAKGLARSSMVLAEQLDTCDKTCVIRYLGKVSKGQMRGIDEAVKVQLGYYIPEQAEKKRQGKCRKEVNFDGG